MMGRAVNLQSNRHQTDAVTGEGLPEQPASSRRTWRHLT